MQGKRTQQFKCTFTKDLSDWFSISALLPLCLQPVPWTVKEHCALSNELTQEAVF